MPWAVVRPFVERSIAQELVVTPKTVENHLGRVYTKLGIDGRRELSTALTV